jgi:hypothetical protein
MAKYCNFKLENITKERYGNGRVALSAYDEEGCIAKLSVNIAYYPLAEDEIAIKDYSENEGVLEDLIEMGVVSEPLRYVLQGFVHIPICKLLY